MVKVRMYKRESPVFRGRIYAERPESDIDIYKVGKTPALLVDPKGRGFMKMRGFGDNIRPYNEAAVSTLNDLLGWNVVPETSIRLYKGELVSLQEFIERPAYALSFSSYNGGRIVNNETGISTVLSRSQYQDLMKMAIIDIIVDSSDRHDTNILVSDDGKLWAIDNEEIFGKPNRGWPDSSTVRVAAGDRIPEHLLNDLKSLDKGDFYATFAYLDKVETIDQAWIRLQNLIALKRIPSDETEFVV